jgi:hypothetical protein
MTEPKQDFKELHVHHWQAGDENPMDDFDLVWNEVYDQIGEEDEQFVQYILVWSKDEAGDPKEWFEIRVPKHLPR